MKSEAPPGPPSHKKRVSWHKRRTFEISNAGHFDELDAGANPEEPATGGQGPLQKILGGSHAHDVTTVNGSMKGHPYDAHAEELSVGQMVRIRNLSGVAWVMWISGDMMGVELEGPYGNCDGYYETAGERYFKTPKNCAYFCAQDQCDLVYDIQAAPRFRYRSHDLNIGDVVMISKQMGVGVVRHSSSQLIGVTLNAPVGTSDGQYEGQRYFQTKAKCAHFCHPAHVKKIDAEELLKKLNETVERLQEIEQDLTRLQTKS